jgi:alpha-1,3-fucosyltransferase
MTIFGTGHDPFVQHGCPVSDCEIVNSRHQYPQRPLESFDAIVFNFNDKFWLTKRPKFQRQPHLLRYKILINESFMIFMVSADV